MMKLKFPTKEEIIQTILAEDPLIKKTNRLILLVEYKKIRSNLGIIKAELVSNGKVAIKGSFTCDPVTSEETSFNWDQLEDGESFPQGFSLDFKSESTASRIKEGFNNAIKQGKIPFFPK